MTSGSALFRAVQNARKMMLALRGPWHFGFACGHLKLAGAETRRSELVWTHVVGVWEYHRTPDGLGYICKVCAPSVSTRKNYLWLDSVQKFSFLQMDRKLASVHWVGLMIEGSDDWGQLASKILGEKHETTSGSEVIVGSKPLRNFQTPASWTVRFHIPEYVWPWRLRMKEVFVFFGEYRTCQERCLLWSWCSSEEFHSSLLEVGPSYLSLWVHIFSDGARITFNYEVMNVSGVGVLKLLISLFLLGLEFGHVFLITTAFAHFLNVKIMSM